MSDIKLVGLDMDGTVLGKDRVLTQNTIDVMEKVSAKGVHLVVDSGRRFPVVPKELRELPFVRYFVLCNGAEIYDKLEDKVLYSSEIPLERALHIYDSLTSHPEVYLDCYQSDGSWARAEDHARIDEFVEDQSHRDVLRNTRTPVEGLRQFLVDRNKPVQKFQTIYKNMAIRDKEMERITAMYPDMTVTSAYTYNLEVNVPDATKGIGLIKLGEILGIPREQIIAFGDGENDISMLQSAGIGYAMENAPDSVKKFADRIAPPNTEDGVAQILTELFL